MDDRAQEILAAARATLARVADVRVEQRFHHDDPLTRWAANMPKREPESEPTPQRLTDAETLRYIGDQIERALARYTELHREVLGMALAHERGIHRAQVEELQTTIGGLTLRLDAITAEFSKAAELHGGDVVDLPKWGRRA